MGDDPNRDLLPVRDGSYVESYRSIIAMTTDPRERHTISKIDRDDLEDKYLRLLEENQELRKLSNSQEDKIKRLGTKLMRVSATPRTFISASLDANSDKNRMDILKMENIKLKDKIVVLRNQILSHRVLRRSPSQTRRLAICTSSRPTTCRSESGRIKSSTCQNFMHDRDDDTITRTYVNKIGELEEQRKQMIARIVELENKLVLSQAGMQKDKIAENVEYIRVRRGMKLGHEKLLEAEAMKKVLHTQLQEMKSLLDETMKNNGQITATLDAEKKKLSEMDERVTRSQDNQFREKDDQIRDLMNEMKILQQHNLELLNLSTKYNQVETENTELKKKISESLADNHNLKSALSNEQTNMKALQAANEQLVEKLQSTQSNIDNLTVQLLSIQNQHHIANKNNTEGESTKREILEKIDKQTSCTSLLSISKSSDVIHKKGEDSSQKFRQRDQNKILESQRHSSSSPIKQNYIPVRTSPTVEIEAHTKNSPKKTTAQETFENGKNNLSRDEMLKLLDEVQINTPLNTKSAISVGQIEGLSPKNYANANYRQSSRSVHSSPSPSSSSPQKAFYRDEMTDQDHRNIVKQIYKMLDDYFRTHFNENDADSMTIFRSNLHPNSENSVNVEQPSTDNKLVISTSSPGPYDVNDLNNNNNNIPKMHEDNTKYPSIHNFHEGWGSEDEMVLINMTRIHDEFEESEQCICNDTERSYEHCLCSTDARKCGTELSHHRFFTEIDDINTILQKTMNHKRPLSHQASSRKKSLECRQSCPVFDETKKDKTCIFEKDKNKRNLIDTPDRSSPILITDQEGLVEIRILSLVFSPPVENSLFNKNGNIIKRPLFISCEFCGKAPISTSRIKYPDSNFNSSCIYQVANLDEFFENISHDSVYLQLHIVFHEDLSYVIAHGKINVKDILIYPQNKLHYIVNMESLVPCYHNKKFGHLSLWIRLSCDTNRVKLFMEQKLLDKSDKNNPINRETKNENGPKNFVSQNNEPTNTVHKMIHERQSTNSKSAIRTSNEYNSIIIPWNSFKIPNDLQGKKALNSSGNETKTEFIDPVENPWQPWERNNHVQAIFYEAGKSNQNTSTEFHNGDNSNRRKRTWLNNDIDDGNDAIVIMIERLKLVQNCSIFRNPGIHRLYIEYTFLGKHCDQYETVSVPIPKSHTEHMYFNYVKKFRFDEQNHTNDRNYLRSILFGEENPTVQFNVVSEPLINEMETEECIDVGHTSLNLKEHILNNCDPHIFLEVRNPENTELIGVLKISILGTKAIRQSLSQSPTIGES